MVEVEEQSGKQKNTLNTVAALSTHPPVTKEANKCNEEQRLLKSLTHTIIFKEAGADA